MMNKETLRLLDEQLTTWETARDNYRVLSEVRTRELWINGISYRMQYNHARIVSSGAKVDAASIARRPCFLCPSHRPTEQHHIPLLGHYEILVNPFPIFPRHFTIVEKEHIPQRIVSRFGDLLELARLLTDYVLFYNGPHCGASAPDHAHFQAGSRGFLPIENAWRTWIGKEIVRTANAALYCLNDAPRTTLVIESGTIEAACQLFQRICRILPVPAGEEESRMNVLALYKDNHWETFVFPRSKHRPACYDANGDARLLCSPASVDLGGVFILPREEDFLKITADDVSQILREVCLPLTALKNGITYET